MSSLTQDLNSSSLDYLPKAEIGQLNIIYNVPHRSLMLHIHDKLTRNTSLIRTQESKREIVYRRMSLPPSARQVIDPQRLAAHLDSTLPRLFSYLQYTGLAKYERAIKALQIIQEININIWKRKSRVNVTPLYNPNNEGCCTCAPHIYIYLLALGGVPDTANVTSAESHTALTVNQRCWKPFQICHIYQGINAV
jgi:hypothetical protein